MKWLFHNFRYKLLALVVAFLLWGVSHSTSPVERGFDVPVSVAGIPGDLVVTDQSTDTVNLRLQGSRAALRSLPVGDLEYRVDLSGAKQGVTVREVDTTSLDLPRGTKPVSRSPQSIEFTLERRGSKAVRVRADLDGEPAPGFVMGEVQVQPARVRITGARSEVLRLNEVLTETIDVSGASAPIVRTVKASLRGGHVWTEGPGEITVTVDVKPQDEQGKETG